jgi:DNA-binding response OmpR family regulator
MSKRVLLCDDDITILRAAEFKLSRAGYEVQCAADGELGWEAIVGRRPDLVITDCQMPRLNGLELIERMRRHPETGNLPVLMLTAKGFELSQRELADKWRVLQVFGKPFSPRELLRRVEEIIGPAREPAPAAGSLRTTRGPG